MKTPFVPMSPVSYFYQLSQLSPAGAELFQEKWTILSRGENLNIDASLKHICEVYREHGKIENPFHGGPRNPLFGH